MQNTSKVNELNWYGFLTPFGGYGINALRWLVNLSRLGVDIRVHDAYKPNVDSEEWKALTEEEKTIMNKPWKKFKVGVVESTPWEFGLCDNEIKIANTMCESDQIGPDWVDPCNLMDHIVVPNEFMKKVFETSGVTKPVHVIRHGVDSITRFKYFDRPKRSTFTFGTVGYLNERKGFFELVRAFASEFEPNEPVELVLKTSNLVYGYYKNWSDPRIKMIDKHLDSRELYELYKSFDCFVFPSRAEGYGQPPREAMATGLPTILTNYSGLEDVCNPDFNYPIDPISFERGVNPIEEQTGNWAKIDIQELMYWMRHVYENRGEAMMKGSRAAAEMRNHHTWGQSAIRMAEFLNTI